MTIRKLGESRRRVRWARLHGAKPIGHFFSRSFRLSASIDSSARPMSKQLLENYRRRVRQSEGGGSGGSQTGGGS